jgi:hypothetical protein
VINFYLRYFQQTIDKSLITLKVETASLTHKRSLLGTDGHCGARGVVARQWSFDTTETRRALALSTTADR